MKKVLFAVSIIAAASPAFAQQVVTGQAAFADWNQQQPGVRRRITAADLPAPAPQEAVNNGPHLVAKPAGAWPIAPAGFKVTLYAGGDFTPTAASSSQNNQAPSVPAAPSTFREPRLLRTAPNGDIFLSDSHGDKIFVLRGVGPDGKAQTVSTFAKGLNLPFGIAFYPADNPKWVYVGNTDSVVRLPYKSGDLVASGPAEKVVAQLPGFAQLRGGGHWTRDIVFTPDGSKMLVSVGSGSNLDDPDTTPNEFHRADVLEFTPEGKFLKVYASGIRNCVGEAIEPTTGELWCSVNERDNLGNHLVPDYVTSVKEDSFYGWPWYYIGSHADPRVPAPCADGLAANPQAGAISPDGKSCKRVDLSGKVSVPDVLVQPHMASLEMAFYTAHSGFPQAYRGDAFAAEHGSWNRANRAGYEVIRIPMHNGKAEGTYEDFLTGFVTKDGEVWGRPVGVTIAHDGSMLVTDDGSRSVWRITYAGK
ncbi:Glucose/arabinose dehydrogenase, beta-propeller fold [Granulicella rosea]|uniref:Glucose/arabinose dehydrogenase, beta-propeller fold n=1 Tax=Granulicella rosea TaxID=474952 RepID=A0A239MI74_9BACT|nr:PQQ-dependent sugar dehydrogenase [Granulicella rosea]SNT42737.1 Glucose/arabinose dehydrogenase, beta-propeller fold [Granulicella rosea]